MPVVALSISISSATGTSGSGSGSSDSTGKDKEKAGQMLSFGNVLITAFSVFGILTWIRILLYQPSRGLVDGGVGGVSLYDSLDGDIDSSHREGMLLSNISALHQELSLQRQALQASQQSLELERKNLTDILARYGSILSGAAPADSSSAALANPPPAAAAAGAGAKNTKEEMEKMSMSLRTVALQLEDAKKLLFDKTAQRVKTEAELSSLRAVTELLERLLVETLGVVDLEGRGNLRGDKGTGGDKKLSDASSLLAKKVLAHASQQQDVSTLREILLDGLAVTPDTGNMTSWRGLEVHFRDMRKNGSVWVDHDLDKALVILHTHQKAFLEKRERIFRTWGRHLANLLTFVGTLPPAKDIEEKRQRDEVTKLAQTEELGADIDGYKVLYKKVLKSYMFLCEKDMASVYEWFMKVDDDLFLVTYNLANALKKFDPEQPHYLGQYMVYKKQGYASGGAGYVLSRGLMKAMCQKPSDGQRGSTRWENCFLVDPKDDEFWKGAEYWGKPEDVYTGACIEKHIAHKMQSIRGFSGMPPSWKQGNYSEFEWLKRRKNPVITYHYVKKDLMYQMYSQFY
mmetsp:Transcript_50315/g.126010  ORF Transcript_50315/g.126010 Transcript_50315/m.126010 type:complete len:572 (-) Transcript_50315:92-1807(-)